MVLPIQNSRFKDKRVFEFFDFITLDDGELPIELLFENVCHSEQSEESLFKRTFLLENGEVVYKTIPKNTIINKPKSEPRLHRFTFRPIHFRNRNRQSYAQFVERWKME